MDLHTNTGTGSDTPPPRQEGMTREALQRVTAQIRAWDKQSVAFDAAIQQILAHDALQRDTITRLEGERDAALREIANRAHFETMLRKERDKLQAEQQRADRLHKDRYVLLSALSEWQLRTSTARQEAKDQKAKQEALVQQLTDAQATIAKQAAELQAIRDTVGDTEFALRQQVARLRALVASAKCPTCDGSGWYHDTDSLTGEPVQAQCRWCTEQQALRETGASL